VAFRAYQLPQEIPQARRVPRDQFLEGGFIAGLTAHDQHPFVQQLNGIAHAAVR
jgi:hypothetical protein